MRTLKPKRPAWADALVFVAAVLLAVPVAAQTSDLVSSNAFRVCADPANSPISSEDGSGYENALAELIAEKLGRPVEYTWFPMATGFIRNTLAAKRCDVVIGFAQGHELVQNTNHYMTSVYTLIVHRDGPLADVTGLSDPRLQGARLGIIAGSPPASQMARYGLMGKARPYNLMVDRRIESPSQDMLADLEAGRINGAVLWGPIGGPLVKAEHPDLKVIPLIGEPMPPKLFYRITMGVRLGEKVWQRELNSLIRRHQDEIDALLIEAGVPLVTELGDSVIEAVP